MTNRESRLYFRRLKHGVKRSLTNNYKKLHGEHMLRAGTMFEYGKRKKYYRRVYWKHNKE